MSTINMVIDSPTLIGSRLAGQTSADSLDISLQDAEHILQGYNNGFRDVFIMNATLAAVATVVSVLMIRHKDLDRGDEEQLKAKAVQEEKEGLQAQEIEMSTAESSRPEKDASVDKQ